MSLTHSKPHVPGASVPEAVQGTSRGLLRLNLDSLEVADVMTEIHFEFTGGSDLAVHAVGSLTVCEIYSLGGSRNSSFSDPGTIARRAPDAAFEAGASSSAATR